MDVGEVSVTHNAGIGVGFLQATEQTQKGAFLTGCAGVGRLAVDIETSFIANTQRVLVIALGVCPYELLMARLIDHASTGHIVVIAGEPEAVAVVAYQRPDAVVLVTPRGTAMHHDQINLTHGRTKLLGW